MNRWRMAGAKTIAVTSSRAMSRIALLPFTLIEARAGVRILFWKSKIQNPKSQIQNPKSPLPERTEKPESFRRMVRGNYICELRKADALLLYPLIQRRIGKLTIGIELLHHPGNKDA